MRRLDLLGLKFNRLLVLDFAGIILNASSWLCRCDCGKETIVNGSKLSRGLVISCGCYTVEVSKKTKTTHGLSGSKVYNAWRKMISRCTDPNNKDYRYYGAKGISICEEWLNIDNFVSDMGHPQYKNLTLDRRDNLKGYSKENCRWVPMKVQNNNSSWNKKLIYNGEEYTMAQLAEISNQPYKRFQMRIAAGFTVNHAMNNTSHEIRKEATR